MSQFNNQDLQALIAEIKAGREQANAANESRFVETKGILEALMGRSGQTYDEVLQNLSTQGRRAQFDVDQSAQRATASAAQDLTNRGLGNTTITSSVNRGILSDAYRAKQNISEGVAAQRAGALENRLGRDIQTTGMLSGLIERRNDIGPDLSMYANLLQQLTASGALGPGGSGTGGRMRTTIGPGSSSYGRMEGLGGGRQGRAHGNPSGVTTWTNRGQVANGSVRTGDLPSIPFEPTPEAPQTMAYARPGLMGWSDARVREFGSAAEAQSAGYNYIQNGYNDYQLIA